MTIKPKLYQFAPSALTQCALVLLALISLVVAGIVFSIPAHAEIKPSDPLYIACMKALNKGAENACKGDSNTNVSFEQARNVGSYHCKNFESQASVKNGKLEKCITANAIKYINKAASEKPSTEAGFALALNKVLNNAGGNPAKAKDVSGATKKCNPTDGLCADCENGGDGCVECGDNFCQDPAADPSAGCSNNSCDFIKKYVNPTINLLSVIFGLLAAMSLIVGGIQYASSAGDPQKVSKAKSRIANTVFAIVAYFFLYAFLQFLVPGGIFNR